MREAASTFLYYVVFILLVLPAIIRIRFVDVEGKSSACRIPAGPDNEMGNCFAAFFLIIPRFCKRWWRLLLHGTHLGSRNIIGYFCEEKNTSKYIIRLNFLRVCSYSRVYWDMLLLYRVIKFAEEKIDNGCMQNFHKRQSTMHATQNRKEAFQGQSQQWNYVFW